MPEISALSIACRRTAGGIRGSRTPDKEARRHAQSLENILALLAGGEEPKLEPGRMISASVVEASLWQAVEDGIGLYRCHHWRDDDYHGVGLDDVLTMAAEGRDVADAELEFLAEAIGHELVDALGLLPESRERCSAELDDTAEWPIADATYLDADNKECTPREWADAFLDFDQGGEEETPGMRAHAREILAGS